MSSHHIVKDLQEPALIIANGEACSLDLLGQLLEWNPLVLVLDGAIYRVLDLGIKVDVWLGDFDRAHEREEILKRQTLEIVHTPDQEKSDLEKGIEYLLQKGAQAVNIVWATGKRADHSISNMTNIVRYRKEIDIVLLDDYSRVLCLPKRFKKWYSKGTPISLIPVGTVQGIRSSGLKYNLHNESLQLGYRSGSSNEAAEDGIVSVEYESGDLLLMECRD